MTVKVSKQDWASGICCNSGTNYSIRITSEELDMRDYFVDTVFIDNMSFYCDLQVIKNKNFILISFGKSYSKCNDNHVFSLKNEGQKPGRDKLIILSTYRKKTELEITTVEELFPLAYP